MYTWLAIDSTIRIAIAMLVLFVVVPRIIWPRFDENGATLLERIWWSLAAGITALVLFGQIASLGRLYSLPAILAGIAGAAIIGRSRARGISAREYVRTRSHRFVVYVLSVLDGRAKLGRRWRRWKRRLLHRTKERFLGVGQASSLSLFSKSPAVRWFTLAWLAVVSIAAVFRLFRPFSTANLGFSDTFVHLYLLKLLDSGKQVDPAWGPYPRGLQFLLLTIHYLTNVDQIMLMNLFGAFVGVLMTLAVADTARRMTSSVPAGLVAGLVFATLVGGSSQYWIVGGGFAIEDQELGRRLMRAPYGEVPQTAGEFDILLTAFQRQTCTLPQELAIVFLFPALLFLAGYLEKRDRWNLWGYGFSVAAIAATHTGVLLPLIFGSAIVAVIAVLKDRSLFRFATRIALAGAAATVVGSSWAIAFLFYRRIGGSDALSSGSNVGRTILFYFPFLRSLAPEDIAVDQSVTFVSITPAFLVCLAAAVLLGCWKLYRRAPLVESAIPFAIVFFMFLHVAPMLGFPEIVEVRRNAEWMIMGLVIAATCFVATLASFVRERLGELSRPRSARLAGALSLGAVLLLWLSFVPNLQARSTRQKLLNYSGYGGTPLALLKVNNRFEPFTWTFVSYGQEFPHVLGRGYHLPASDFLETYDPTEPTLEIPTPYVFIAVEKEAHPFQINTWKDRFSRTDVEGRLQAWCVLYGASHGNMRLFMEDSDVRVYMIDQSSKSGAGKQRGV